MLSLEDNKVAKSGEESLVKLAVESGEDINLNDVEVYMKALGEPTCGECGGKGRKCKVHKYGLRYVKSPSSVLLPPMKYKIEGPSWDLTVGRNQLTQYMLLEGYGEGGSLSYKEDRPGWWPESIDHKEWFAKFKHPGGAQIKHSALFLRAILQYYGHDAESYHHEVIVEESEPKRKKPQKKWKKNKSKQVVDTTIDEDDVEEEANRARAARAMETARAGVRDTVNVRNMVEDHDMAEVTDMVEEQYEVRDVEESRETMSGSEMEMEVVTGVTAATTPPRRKLTGRRYSLQPPSPQPHAGCGLDITWPLIYDAFKPPSKKEVQRWLPSSESASILTLSPHTSSKSPSILTLTPESSPLVSGSAAPTSPSTDEPEVSEYLKLQEKNILEKQQFLKDMDIPVPPKKKSPAKRKRPAVSNVVLRKSARLAERGNQEAADSPAGGQEAEESSAGGQEAADSLFFF